MIPMLAATLGRLMLTDTQAVHVTAALAESLGPNLSNFCEIPFHVELIIFLIR